MERFEEADLCVVNTCTVTREADKDALRLIRRIAWRNPAARLVVTGCLADRDPREILEAAPAAIVAGNASKDAIPAMLGCAAAPDFPGITALHRHSRAFVKVQDGCNMHCTYCVIPSVRSSLSCRPPGEVEAELRGLVASGVREIVLCGIRLGRYLAAEDSPEAGVTRGLARRVDFVALLERLLALPGDFRIRLSSLEVTDLTDRLLDASSRWEGRLAPSFHVPLQSGSEPVLRRMGRWYSAAFYARRVEALRRRRPGAGLFTDMMVGFPGETEAQFRESLDFAERMGFAGLHVFRYSRRPGTPAAQYPASVPEREIEERSKRMRALDIRLREAFAARAVGTRRRVLLEGGAAGAKEGLTDHFLRVRFEPEPKEVSGFVLARINASLGACAIASALESDSGCDS